MLRQALDGAGVEQVRGVLEHRFDAMRMLDRVKHQVELGSLALPFQTFNVQFAQAGLRIAAAFGLVVEHHLEQRAVAQAAAWLQRFHQLLERQILMGLGILRSLADLAQQLDE
ncbi:hypothetical protein [Pseudomonas sp. 25 R 14]|nr:hypothetical protein [Pseudomonas sp. 25 R 14]